MNSSRRNNDRRRNWFRLRPFSYENRGRGFLNWPIRFRWRRRLDYWRRSIKLLFLRDARGNCSRRFGGRFDLPLQFEQVAPQSVAHLHAQVGEFQESLAKFALLPDEVDREERRGSEQYSQHHSEHYEYELH